MRIFLTSLFAFMLSRFAGGMVAQGLAEGTMAGEEYILVFMLLPLLTLVATIIFFVAQFPVDARRSVDRVGRWLSLIYGLAALGLIGFQTWILGGDIARLRFSWPILVGLILPGLVMLMVHWLFVRWRVGKPPVGFGRAPA